MCSAVNQDETVSVVEDVHRVHRFSRRYVQVHHQGETAETVFNVGQWLI